MSATRRWLLLLPLCLLLMGQDYNVPFRPPAAGGSGGDIAVGITEAALGGSGATTASVTSTAGSVILIGCSCPDGATLSDPTDSKSNTYSAVVAEQDNFSRSHRVWQNTNGTRGASHTFTCNCSSGATDIFAVEFLNAATASAIDTQNATNDASSPYGAGITTGTANTGLAAFLFHDAGSGSCVHSSTGSFTVQDEITNATTDWPGASATRLVSSTGTYNPAWTIATCTGTTTSAVIEVAVKD